METATKVTVGGQDYHLEVSLETSKKIGRAFGGIKPAIEQLPNINIEAWAQIIAIGANLKPKNVTKVEQAIFETVDKSEIIYQLSEFLLLMLSGGQKISVDSESAEEGNL